MRRLVMVQGLASFEEVNNDRPAWIGKRPIGSGNSTGDGTEREGRSAPRNWCRLIGLNKLKVEGRQYEEIRAKPLLAAMDGSKVTFEEDKAFREMFKELGEKNQDWTNSRITLPWEMSYDLDMEKDPPLATERIKKLGG